MRVSATRVGVIDTNPLAGPTRGVSAAGVAGVPATSPRQRLPVPLKTWSMLALRKVARPIAPAAVRWRPSPANQSPWPAP